MDFLTQRHNEIRDINADLLAEVCNDVQVEQDLQPINDEEFTGLCAHARDSARLDIAANGVGIGQFERTYFDVCVFNPHALSNRHPNSYRKHEMQKKRKCEQRIREIGHSSFTPLVMSATGGLANQATVFYKRFASSLAQKLDQPYSTTK